MRSQQFWIALLLSGMSVVLAPLAIQSAEPAAQTETLASRIDALAKREEERERKFRSELRAAKRDLAKVSAANKVYSDEASQLATELKTLIAENAADPASFPAVLLLVGEVRHPLNDDLTSIVIDHHLTNAEAGKLCFHLRYRYGDPSALRILEAVSEKHPQAEVRGQALFALGDYYRIGAFPFGVIVSEERQKALLDQAAKYYQQVLDEHAEAPAPFGATSLGKKARHELTRVKNLPNLKVGRPAPPIVGEDLHGEPLRLEDYRGKVVVVVFWGSWCGPCMAMVPHERELHHRHRDRPFALLGINCGDARELAKETATQHEMKWPSWWDSGETRGPIQTEYNIQKWPTLFVIDASGVIRAIDVRDKALDEVVDDLLAEMTPAPAEGSKDQK